MGRGRNDSSSSRDSRRSHSRSDRGVKDKSKKDKKKDRSTSPHNKLESFMDDFTKKFDKFSVDVRGDLKYINDKFEAHEGRMDGHDAQLADHALKIQQMVDNQKSHSERIEKSLEESTKATRAFARPVPSSPAAPGSSSDGFDRPARKNTIRASVEGNVKFQKSEFERIIKEILQSKGLECELETPGPALANRLSTIFQGPAGEEIAQSVLRARKDSAGAWIPYAVKLPEGTTAKLYLSADQSPKTNRTEAICKKFKKYLEEKYVGNILQGNRHNFDFRKDTGVILVDGRRLAIIEVSKEKAKLSWSIPVLNETGFSKDELASYFEATFNTQWSS
jgi:hypothetical protein